MNKRLDVEHVFRYCPKCASADFKAVQNNLLICKACGFNYFINACAAVAGIITNSDRSILLTVRAKQPELGKLDLPGGFINLNETAEDALAREIKEELNLEIEKIKYFCSIPNVYEYKGLNYNTLDLFYCCEVKGFSQIKVADDVSDYLFQKVDEIETDKIGFLSVRKGIELYAKNYTG